MASRIGAAPAGPAPPAVHCVTIPSAESILEILSTGGPQEGIVSVFMDLYTQLNSMSSSITVALGSHISKNNINHDALEGFVNSNSIHIDEHRQTITSLLARISELETRISTSLSAASSTTTSSNKSMSLDPRCKSLGKLGADAEYRKWTDDVSRIAGDAYSYADKLLSTAKQYGNNYVTYDDFILFSIQSEDLLKFDKDLYGLLKQQSVAAVWTALDNLRDIPLSGLNSWREIHYSCNPKQSA